MDRIEKQIILRAPRSRVWRAIADRTEFGRWFGVSFPAGTFAPGEKVAGNITSKGYEHMVMEIELVDVEPERRLSYHWHPYSGEENPDYSAEPPTLVTFTLEDVADGTLLRVVESGFENVPLHRRQKAIEGNERGWAAQMTNIERHVTSS